jgi:hypothetical protein
MAGRPKGSLPEGHSEPQRQPALISVVTGNEFRLAGVSRGACLIAKYFRGTHTSQRADACGSEWR